MKYKGNKKLIIYVITYGPKSTRSLLGDTAPLKDSLPLKFQKSSAPGKCTTGIIFFSSLWYFTFYEFLYEVMIFTMTSLFEIKS